MQIGLASLNVRGLPLEVNGLESDTFAQHAYKTLAFCLNREVAALQALEETYFMHQCHQSSSKLTSK